jgi:predicted RND superfamily exporter protein
MVLSSFQITTAIAFFATAICPVAPLKAFAVFCGLLIIFDYIMCVFLVFPAICLYDRWKEAGSRNCCVSCHCCRRIEAGDDEAGFGDELDIHSDPSQWSFIHRFLLRLYQLIHRIRWVLLAAIIGGLVASIITASKWASPSRTMFVLWTKTKSV